MANLSDIHEKDVKLDFMVLIIVLSIFRLSNVDMYDIKWNFDFYCNPSEISCKQDLGQDTRYRNASRS